MESAKDELEMPGGSIPEYQRWQNRVDQGGGERAYIDLDGKSHPLKEGERFSVKLDRAANRYDAVVTGSNGSETVVGSGPMNPGAPIKDVNKNAFNLNKSRLNEIFRAASTPGARFDHELQLAPEDRQSIAEIGKQINVEISQLIDRDAKWNEFKQLEAGLDAKGHLGAGAFPPSWLKNGGPNAQIQVGEEEYEIQGAKGKRVTITVPEYMYNAYYYLGVANDLLEIETKQNALRGTNARNLSKQLNAAAEYLRQTGKL